MKKKSLTEVYLIMFMFYDLDACLILGLLLEQKVYNMATEQCLAQVRFVFHS